MGYAEMTDPLISDVKKHAACLERCLQQAEAVLYGDLSAANSLWLLLREPVSACPVIPQSILDEIETHTQLVEPLATEGAALLRLIAGVVRAANQPSEENECSTHSGGC